MNTQPIDHVEAVSRRTDLDWVRIIAFGLLILYHIGMFYVPWDWDVKSPRIVDWLQIPMQLTNPWRLLLLFIVSGAATSFMTRRLRASELLKSRSRRLLPPLLFGVLLIIPPQSYIQVVERYGYLGSFFDFWPRYVTADHSFCKADGCLYLPTWKHLWFVAYLWTYTVLLVVLLALWPAQLDQLRGTARRLLSGWRLLVIPALVLIAARLTLKHFFPPTNYFIGDWYQHTIYFLGFMFGFMFARSEEIWVALTRLRWPALGLAIVAYAVYATYVWTHRGAPGAMGLRVAMAGFYGLNQWAWCVAAMGFAHRYLTGSDGPVRRYLTDAIFPYYIVHQTAIVLIAHDLEKLQLPLVAEAAILIVATAASCAVTYEIVRRITWLRPWFGLKPLAAPTPVNWPALERRLAGSVPPSPVAPLAP